MRQRSWVVSVLLLLCAMVGGLSAQAPVGKVVGKIVDADKGTPISGAVVSVVGGTATAESGLDGRYTLANVPAGTVGLRVRYIGYQPKLVSGVVVPAGGTATQDIGLTTQVVELEELTVAAQAEQGSVNRALEEQRYAPNVVSGVTREQIAKSPDSDAGQAVQRVSGVTVQDGKYVFVRGLGERYTTTELNGARVPSPEPEKKVVPLDIFPAGILEGITTSKTFTPDQPGDFSGAVVNLRTREFPAQRVITLSTGAGFNSAATGQDVAKAPAEGAEWLGFAGSARRLPSALAAAGDFSGSTQADVNGYIASLRDVWSAKRGTGSPNGSFGMSLGGEDPVFGQRIGYLGSFNYGYSQEVREDEQRALATTGGPINQYRGGTTRASVLWGGLVNLSTRIGTGTRLQFNNTYSRTADNEAVTLDGVNEEFSQLGRLDITRLTFTERSVRSHQVAGEHQLGERHFVEWRANAAKTRRYEPDRSDLIYTAAADGSPLQWADIRQSATRTFSDINETNYDLAGSYRLGLGALTNPVFVKVGGAYRTTNRDADSRAYDLRNLDLTTAELSQRPEDVFSRTNALAGRLLLSPNTNGGRYTAEDAVSAGFVQVDLPLANRIQVIAGARVEHWSLDLLTRTTQGATSPVARRHTDVLPALGLNIRLTGTQTLRLSATQTLSRPEYRELSSAPSFEVLGGLVTRGNPSLDRALIQNLDARWEFYPNSGEVLSLGVFAKRFDNPIERVIVATTGAPELGFVNADKANNYGVEVEVRKNLGLLGEGLRSLTAFSNVTLMRSRITPGNDSLSALTSSERPMVGQAGYVVNGGLSWLDAGGRWSATALFNLVGRRISEAGQNPLPDTYEEARAVLDLSLQAPVFSTLTLKVDAKNLLDAPYNFTQGSVTRLKYRSGRVFGASFQWRP